jgi:reactive intermediate/imine deaminase
VAAAAAVVALLASSSAGSSEPVAFLNSGTVLPDGLPFSEAVRVGNLLFLSGQVGIDPATMEIVSGGIAEETRQTMKNIGTTLEAHGYAMSDLVKCTIMLADISEWESFNAVYTSFFSAHFPARSAFGTSGLAFDAGVEIDCIAAQGS